MHNKKPISYQLVTSLILLLHLFWSCSPPNKNDNKTSNYQETRSIKIKLNYNQSFTIEEIRKGTSIADIYVSGIGFNKNSKTYSFLNTYPFHDFLISDLNNDGFEELFIIASPGGKTKKIQLHGVTSINGTNYKPIYCPEFDKNTNYKFNYLKGYKGGDSIYIKDSLLIRVFPLVNKSSHKKNKRVLFYQLLLMDDSYSLQVTKTTDVLKN